MSKYPFNVDLKNSYYRLYRIYNKNRKYKAKNHKNNIIKQLEELESNDPKAYWALINSLKEKTDNNIPVTPSEFKDHFEKLNEIPSKYQQRINIIKSALKHCEDNSKLFTELDFAISDYEILSSVAKLKNNKSGGLHLIKNNILKAGKVYLLPSIKKLFNNILLSGFYPNNWSTGYLSPIFKSGDRGRPENYRGIAITGCLGKLFNSIFNHRLDKFLIQHDLISPFQIGFTKKYRPSDHMFVLKTIIDKYTRNK